MRRCGTHYLYSRSRISRSCIFQILHFPVLHFSVLHFPVFHFHCAPARPTWNFSTLCRMVLTGVLTFFLEILTYGQKIYGQKIRTIRNFSPIHPSMTDIWPPGSKCCNSVSQTRGWREHIAAVACSQPLASLQCVRLTNSADTVSSGKKL